MIPYLVTQTNLYLISTDTTTTGITLTSQRSQPKCKLLSVQGPLRAPVSRICLSVHYRHLADHNIPTYNLFRAALLAFVLGRTVPLFLVVVANCYHLSVQSLRFIERFVCVVNYVITFSYTNIIIDGCYNGVDIQNISRDTDEVPILRRR